MSNINNFEGHSGYFELFPALNEAHLSCTHTIAINFGKLPARQFKQLYTAVDSGCLPAFGGKVAALYRVIATGYGWPYPHLWSASKYAGAKFFVTEHEWLGKVAPFLAPLVPENCELKYVTTDMSVPDHGTVQKIGRDRWYQRDNALVVKSAPDILLSKLIDLDRRPREQVNGVLNAMDREATIQITMNK